MLKKLTGIISLIILSIGFSLIISKGIDKAEAVECNQWQQQAENIKGFYWTEWQKAQCNTN